MAKKSMKNRELKRQLTVAKFAKKRAELKAVIANPNSTRSSVGKPRSPCKSNRVTPAPAACVPLPHHRPSARRVPQVRPRP